MKALLGHRAPALLACFPGCQPLAEHCDDPYSCAYHSAHAGSGRPGPQSIGQWAEVLSKLPLPKARTVEADAARHRQTSDLCSGFGLGTMRPDRFDRDKVQPSELLAAAEKISCDGGMLRGPKEWGVLWTHSRAPLWRQENAPERETQGRAVTATGSMGSGTDLPLDRIREGWLEIFGTDWLARVPGCWVGSLPSRITCYLDRGSVDNIFP